MEAAELIEILENDLQVSFYTGVPDSLLSPFTGEIMKKYGISDKHIIAANEGNAVGLAAGFHMATEKIPCVYMQNSGQGNMINPFVSLMAPDVYRIPCIFIIGWRGQPGTQDEPQHVMQGKITETLLDVLQIEKVILHKNIKKAELKKILKSYQSNLKNGKCIAIIIEKDALTAGDMPVYKNPYCIKREDAIKIIVEEIGDAPVISTTGKASRELFEIREGKNSSHRFDFLTVGSMGHSSSIALAIAIYGKSKKVWCIDGDGSLLMHMGAMALAGANQPENLVHIVLNNEAHETVGGMPTVANRIDILKIAEGCGYLHCYQVDSEDALRTIVRKVKEESGLTLIEVKVAMGARLNLGRPTTTPIENKECFMRYLKEMKE